MRGLNVRGIYIDFWKMEWKKKGSVEGNSNILLMGIGNFKWFFKR